MPLATPARSPRIRATPVKDALIAMLGALPPEPDDVALQPLIQALADQADSAPTRKMGSVQAMLREHGREISSTVRERVAVLAKAELDRREQNQPAASISPAASKDDWYSLKEAALRLGIREDVLAEHVHHHEQRRRYGYPRWDGYQWKFSSLAIEPATSAAFLATLPAHEGIPELLPDWCIREGQERAPREAKTDEERTALRWPKLAPGAS